MPRPAGSWGGVKENKKRASSQDVRKTLVGAHVLLKSSIIGRRFEQTRTNIQRRRRQSLANSTHTQRCVRTRPSTRGGAPCAYVYVRPSALPCTSMGRRKGRRRRTYRIHTSGSVKKRVVAGRGGGRAGVEKGLWQYLFRNQTRLPIRARGVVERTRSTRAPGDDRRGADDITVPRRSTLLAHRSGFMYK